MPEYSEEEEAIEIKYVYWVSYFCESDLGVVSFGSAEVVLSKPVSEFDDVVGMGKAIAASHRHGTVSVLNWRLLREEMPNAKT